MNDPASTVTLLKANAVVGVTAFLNPDGSAGSVGIQYSLCERREFRRHEIGTTPLRGLFTRMKGGFYHDGRFANLDAVVNHYDSHFKLNLSAAQKRELVEYLKSL